MSANAPDVGGASFLDTLAERLGSGDSPFALLFVDCGLVGRVDALWGYRAGDGVRARIATLLRGEVLREGDWLTFVGRDEVACALVGVEDPAIAFLAAERALRALGAPFLADEDEIFANPTVGIAVSGRDSPHAESSLRLARNACAAARASSLHTAVAQDDAMDPVAVRFLDHCRLRAAVTDDSLEMVFQPQYDLKLGQIMGAEALLRWPGETHGVVATQDAFAAAEAAGTASGLVSSMLNRALRNVSEFRYSGGVDLRLSIRLPSSVLLHEEVPDVVQAALATWRLRAGRLSLSIGETSLLRAEPEAQATLGRLKALGVKLAIDDPNVELSALFWLATLPFQEMRLDVSALGTLANAPKSESILRSIVSLCHDLRLEVLAYGAADEAASNRLKELGCDHLQADFKGPALDPHGFVTRYGFAED